MEELIKKISRDNEHYEIDPEDTPIVCTFTGKRLTEDMFAKLDDEKKQQLKNALVDFGSNENNVCNIIVINSYYYESKRYGDYKIIRRISKLDGMRVVD